MTKTPGIIAIVDYGVGNLFSLRSSLKALGYETLVSGNAAALKKAARIILPGVGAFGDAMAKLRQAGLVAPLQAQAASGKPFLGICLGMQLLFEKSHEFGLHEGLGLIKGEISPFAHEEKVRKKGLKVPHMGWNPLHIVKPASSLMAGTKEGASFYYVHSFYATGCAANTVATSEYGVDVPGVVQNDNVFGTQFHPEKSGKVGLALLRAFAEMPV